ncbi:MAG TPA: glycerol kinase GlpK [Lachnospiraceae bacterium]|nr:glycerol kinase GlpK [Lachnospiraceae bacterium]HPF29005.1 glycerol kinase GlpK [Lachnospiraceae bacterium]
MGQYIMALDQGTTSSRCILFDHAGRICASAQKEFTQYYPKPGWVEHDPMEIWSSQLSVAIEALGKIHAKIEEVEAIGITNQRETTIVWDKLTGKPVYPAIVWQCRRTADRIDQLISDGMESYVRETTGLVPDAYFSATKIAWILNEVEGARERAKKGELLFGTVDSWLIYNLTEGQVHETDYTNASRTMLYNIHKLEWDEQLLSYFKIPACMLPKVLPSGHLFGETSTSLIGKRIPIAGVAGDQQAALFGQGCFHAGEVKNTYGTGCFLLMNTGDKAIVSGNGLITTIAAGCTTTPSYALEGSVFVAGAAIQWLRDELQLITTAADSEIAATSVADTAGVYMVPAFTGLGAPYWNPYARGMIVGLTRGANKNHLIRASLESLAYQTMDVINAMEADAGLSLRKLQVDGGASSNNFLMQFQADLLGTQVVRPSCVETTALGAAFLAGLTTGFWKDEEELKSTREQENSDEQGKTFVPTMKDEEKQMRQNGWKKAVRCALAYAE